MGKPEAFTATSLRDIGTAALAVTLVSNFLYVVAKIPAKVSAPVIAIAIPCLLQYTAGPQSFMDYLIAFLNGCLIFFTAYGMNGAVGKAVPAKLGVAPSGRRRWFDPWF